MGKSTNSIIVAVSGSGRSLENLLIDQTRDGLYRVIGVITSKPDCRAVTIARNVGLPVLEYWTKSANAVPNGIVLEERLRELEGGPPDLVVLAGFTKKFPTLPCFEGQVINIHPALLPDFGGQGMYGSRVHEAVLKAGVKGSGATVHFVNDQYDEGRIIAQARVPVLSKDSTDVLAERVFRAEVDLLPRVIRGLLLGTLPLPGNAIYQYDHIQELSDS